MSPASPVVLPEMSEEVQAGRPGQGGLSPAPMAAAGAAAGRPSDPDLAEIAASIQALLGPESLVKIREPLARRTTLRVGGPADLYVEPAGDSSLAALHRFCTHSRIPMTVLGRGSNLLVRDGGVRGVVVCLSHPSFSRIEVQGTRITAGAGARLKDLAQAARRAGIGGLEFFDGIPGSLGGALRMNAGAMGTSTFARVATLRVLLPDQGIRELDRAMVEVEYRSCRLLKQAIALGAVLEGTEASPESIAATMSAYNSKRWESQPSQPSAGCIFKNPRPDLPAGLLIDQLGLKGMRSGHAMVSDVHANFIVNLGGASARDVLSLVEQVRKRARDERAIDLQIEVEILGEDTEPQP